MKEYESIINSLAGESFQRPVDVILYDFVADYFERNSFNWEINRSQYKDKILEGVSEIDIIREVNTRNKKMRTNNKMTLALEGSAERGTGKYKQAIELIKTGAPDEVVIKKTKVLAEEIVFLKNGLLPS